MAILEALACRLPVVITTACHFPELGATEGGIIVEPTAESVTNGLRYLLGLAPDERFAIAGRGRDLVESNYTWDRQAERLESVYEWLAGGGPVPEAIVPETIGHS